MRRHVGEEQALGVPHRPTREAVALVYRGCLGRQASDGEIDAQVEHAPSLSALLSDLLQSPEFQARETAQRRNAVGAFSGDLRLLHDTLARTQLAGYYWAWGGLLIGWAREGQVLEHDAGDADFALRREDVWRLAGATPALRAAGFAPSHRFRDNQGRAVEFSYRREQAKFEFFVLDQVGDMYRYYNCTDGHRGDGAIQAAAEIPVQSTVPFDFLERTWLKHADHEQELTRMYGDWRTPDPDWWYMDDRASVQREPWSRAAELAWDGTFDAEES